MLQQFADNYIEIGELIHHLITNFWFIESAQRAGIQDKEDTELTEQEKKRLKETLTRLHKICGAISLPVSESLLSSRINDLPESSRELNLLIDALKNELKSHLFLHVNPDRAKHFNTSGISDSDDAIRCFPKAYEELREASNCYALERDTGAVFHAMRAAEIAVRALAAKLGVNFPMPLEQVEWQNLLDKINAEIRAIGQSPKTASKPKQLELYSQAAAQLGYLKDGWRIHVAHARATYDQQQAVQAINHTASLIKTMAPEISEPA